MINRLQMQYISEKSLYMRKIVNLTEPKNSIVRLMICNEKNGTFLFGYKKTEDCNSEFDEWYESEIDALESCEIEYGININDWKKIQDAEENCQQDWINPVRVKGRESGNPEFGKLEKKVNGEWVNFLCSND